MNFPENSPLYISGYFLHSVCESNVCTLLADLFGVLKELTIAERTCTDIQNLFIGVVINGI